MKTSKNLTIEEIRLELKRQASETIKKLFKWKGEVNDLLEQYEVYANVKIRQIMEKHKSKFFDVKDLFQIKGMLELNNIFIFIGNRNIGKSFSAMRFCRDLNFLPQPQKYIIMKSHENELQQRIALNNDYFVENNFYEAETFRWSDERTIFRFVDPARVEMGEQVGAYYIALNRIGKKRSMDYNNTQWIFYDEFDSDEGHKIKNKFYHFSRFTTTIQRYQENLKAILVSNFNRMDEQMRQAFGLGLKKTEKDKVLIFNWVLGSIIFQIPPWAYKQRALKLSNTGMRLAAIDNIEYTSQFGSEYTDDYKDFVINVNDLKVIKLWVALAIPYDLTLANQTEYIFFYKAMTKENKPIKVMSSRQLTQEKIKSKICIDFKNYAINNDIAFWEDNMGVETLITWFKLWKKHHLVAIDVKTFESAIKIFEWAYNIEKQQKGIFTNLIK